MDKVSKKDLLPDDWEPVPGTVIEDCRVQGEMPVIVIVRAGYVDEMIAAPGTFDNFNK